MRVGAGGGAVTAEAARSGTTRREPVLEEDQRAIAVPGGDERVGLAHHVAEHLERDRSAVARLEGGGDDAGDVEGALAGEAAEVPAPLEEVHPEQRPVRDLQEADPVAGDPGRARVPSSPRASMWKVSTASVTAGWSARSTASHAWPTRLTCRPQASAS